MNIYFTSMLDLDLDLDFESLRDLHDSVNDLLNSPATKLEVVNQRLEQWANQVSEASLEMADSCAAARDLLVLSKEHLQHLQSTFRRLSATTETAASGNSAHHFAPYRLPRKQLRKEILKRMHSIEGIKSVFFTASPEDTNLVVVVNLLSAVRATILAMVKSLLSLISTPSPEAKPNTMESLKLRLMRVDSLIIWGKYDAEATRSAIKRLEVVETVMEDLDSELGQILRRLIRTRASLLNITTS